MPVSVEQDDKGFVIRMKGETGLAVAAELKDLIVDGLAAGKEVQLELEGVEEIDVSLIQLLHAAKCEADRVGVQMTIQMSESVRTAMCGAGITWCVEGVDGSA